MTHFLRFLALRATRFLHACNFQAIALFADGKRLSITLPVTSITLPAQS